LRHVPEYEDYLLEQWRMGTFGPYWEQIGINAEHHYENIPDIPILHMSSWYDVYVGSTLKNRTSLSESKCAPQHLIMGPWLHGDRNVTHSGDVDFGPAAAFDGNVDTDWVACRIRWFERWLTQNDERQVGATVKVFLMGGGSGQRDQEGHLDHGGQWLRGDQWPLMGSQEEVFYLHNNLSLGSQPPVETHACRSYISNPDHPVPTIGGALTSGAPVFYGGAFDQRETSGFFASQGNDLPLCARPDVLSFQTAPLEKDLIVAGPISIELFVESEGLDTDFTAKLVDVYPPSSDYPQGYAMNITDGILRCRYRNNWSEPTLMTPGERVRIRIEPFATCNRFAKGHRLRLDIASSNFPHFDVNPNSGEPEGQALQKTKVLNTVHFSKQCPSRLILTTLDESQTTR
jgi:putative CocE/NonD family hydrolase